MDHVAIDLGGRKSQVAAIADDSDGLAFASASARAAGVVKVVLLCCVTNCQATNPRESPY